ncbi:MAG: hypothetical protein S4CHLAM7_08800 [Chlamydiae bacterium]|nr:hypothetical protein [Chlamydiota bacterium]
MDNVRAQLIQAIEKESKQFQEYYLWLEESMPKDFFADIKFEDIILITHSLMGFRLENYYSQINLNGGAIVLCMEHPKADIQILKNFSLYGIKYYCAYTSKQPPPIKGVKEKLRIVIINYLETRESHIFPISEDVKREIKSEVQQRNPQVSDEAFKKLSEQMNTRFLATLSKDRITLAFDMLFRAQERDPCQYEVRYNEDWQQTGQPSMHIVFAWKNTSRANFFYHLAKVVFRHNLTMKRVHAAHINPHTDSNVLVMVIGLQGIGNKPAWEACDIADFLRELVTVKYFAKVDLIDNVFVNNGIITGNLANFLRASIDFIHQILVHVDAYEYTPENIEEGICRHQDLIKRLCEAFECKFHPEKNDLKRYRSLRDEFLDAVSSLDTGKEDIDERHRNILIQAINFIEFTLKTNFYRNNKVALSFRLDPSYLDHTPFEREELFPVLPFGIYYVKGLCFFGFHIRFKDLARGGLRTVVPKRLEYVQFDRNEVFMENYSLAFTQHKKNKDIPEGGSKAVIFLEPSALLELEREMYFNELTKEKFSKKEIETRLKAATRLERLSYLHHSQRAFVDSLITLVNCEDDGTLRAKHIVSYYPKPEYIYLGPDENMHTEIIEWIAEHSKKYKYRPGSSFISSKPVIGINHKEHGVTSLGVNVCMHKTLEFLGINPTKDVFTVKMTGGPDGDVAGNQMKNLHNYYPKTAKLLATVDVSGTIFDPNGLNLEELLHLFESEKPINGYNPEKLSEGGYLVDMQMKKDESAYSQKTLCYRKRDGKVIEEWLSGNEMNRLIRHNVHQTVADIFIPCGGRPATLNINNYVEFLNPQGQPTSKAIIEGANLYLTPKARKALEELGVLVIRDSSANKGGVIASSFEVLCGLILNDDEMKKHHQEIVDETLKILGQRSLEEAQLMLRSHKELGLPLTEISEKISHKINFYTYQLLDYFESLTLSKDHNDSLNRCLLSYCPEFLRKTFTKQILNDLPDIHKKAIIASYLAAKVVYKMGLNWSPTLVGILPILLHDPEICGN